MHQEQQAVETAVVALVGDTNPLKQSWNRKGYASRPSQEGADKSVLMQSAFVFLTKGEVMDIDSMTYGELKQIAAMFGAAKQEAKPHPFVGKYVIARCYSAGVHAGEVVSADGENVILKDSRRLWSWKAKDGVALSGVAQNGLKSEGKVDTLNPEIALMGVCELIPCSAKAQESIDGFK